MAAKKKPKTARSKLKRGRALFLVVRGEGSTTFVGVGQAIKDAALAKTIDGYRATPRDGVARASRAFVVKSKRAAEKAFGGGGGGTPPIHFFR